MREFFLQPVSVGRTLRLARNAALVLAGVAGLLALLLWRMWQIRGSIDQLEWPQSTVASEPGNVVTATWLGTTTILFDDGETQVLIDGAFSRIGALDSLLFRRVRSDIASINYAMSAFGINRLAAVIPVHSHHDHAIDVAHVANRSTAVVLGSESTANIARGGDVPVDQYQILADGETRQFGDFTIQLIASRHAPIGLDGQEVFPGIIETPLRQPARISEYRTGVAWSVVLSHPKGTTLVQGSAGFIEGKLDDIEADVVMLSVAGLAGIGEEYTRDFWRETVGATGTARVIAIHHDDFSAPFGEVRLLPDVLDNVLRASVWLDALAAEDGVTIELPPFGEPIALY
jgi:L-ascorbate metabolism protein UlaG (beta-lactamase superfamily)